MVMSPYLQFPSNRSIPEYAPGPVSKFRGPRIPPPVPQVTQEASQLLHQMHNQVTEPTTQTRADAQRARRPNQPKKCGVWGAASPAVIGLKIRVLKSCKGGARI